MRDQHVWLNSASLEAAHAQILLQHIDEGEPAVDVHAEGIAGAPGQAVTGWKIRQRDVRIAFAVRERLDFAKRAAAISAVAGWIGTGGWLEISSRPGLRLWVTPTQFPGPGRLRDWTHEISITLTAFEWPLWTEKAGTTVSLSGVTEDSASITVPGNYATALEAVITPTGGTLTSAEITAGGETMTLSDLAVTAGTPLTIARDERHRLRVTAGGQGLLSHRTGGDLTLAPGAQAVGLSLSTACTVELTARGCWL